MESQKVVAEDLTKLSDEELLNLFASDVDRQNGTSSPEQQEIYRRIESHSKLRVTDCLLIVDMVGKLQKIESEDFDLPHQSQRVKVLNQAYQQLRDALLARMRGEDSTPNEVPCCGTA